ncbi:MAG: hypothetical protein RIS94_3377 [Pseudomonadota bacterium]|jgi:acetyl-CoA carboxylase biotin carboxyl carrier protein
MTHKPTIDHPVDHVRVLMEEFKRSGIATLHLRAGGFELLLSNDANAPSLSGGQRAVAAPVPAAPAPLAAPVATPVPAATAPSSVPANAVIIAAPNLGTFYRAPKPGAAPYVEIGGSISVGDEICLIEVMKLFTGVKADRAGTVVAILAEDGAMVESGQPLFALVAG